MILVHRAKCFGLSSLALIARRCRRGGSTKLNVRGAELETQRVLWPPRVVRAPRELPGAKAEERRGAQLPPSALPSPPRARGSRASAYGSLHSSRRLFFTAAAKNKEGMRPRTLLYKPRSSGFSLGKRVGCRPRVGSDIDVSFSPLSCEGFLCLAGLGRANEPRLGLCPSTGAGLPAFNVSTCPCLTPCALSRREDARLGVSQGLTRKRLPLRRVIPPQKNTKPERPKSEQAGVSAAKPLLVLRTSRPRGPTAGSW